jgi:putative glutamine amidotransferase
VRLNEAYGRALEGAGIVPLVVPPLLRPDDAVQLLDRVDGLVLTGGEDVDPARYGAPRHGESGPAQHARDATEIALALGARERRLPTLAICRGIQLLNVALGGTLVQDLPSERGTGTTHDPGGDRTERTHAVSVSAGSRLAAAVGGARASLPVNSFHHQAVDRVAPSLRVTACSPDGVIEAAETAPDDPWWVLAVQWHPEELTAGAEEWDRGIFRAFAEKLEGGGRRSK